MKYNKASNRAHNSNVTTKKTLCSQLYFCMIQPIIYSGIQSERNNDINNNLKHCETPSHRQFVLNKKFIKD